MVGDPKKSKEVLSEIVGDTRLPDDVKQLAKNVLAKVELSLPFTDSREQRVSPAILLAHGLLAQLSPMSRPADTQLEAVQPIVDSLLAEGYLAYWHTESDREWVFLCKPEQGVCLYYMS